MGAAMATPVLRFQDKLALVKANDVKLVLVSDQWDKPAVDLLNSQDVLISSMLDAMKLRGHADKEDWVSVYAMELAGHR